MAAESTKVIVYTHECFCMRMSLSYWKFLYIYNTSAISTILEVMVISEDRLEILSSSISIVMIQTKGYSDFLLSIFKLIQTCQYYHLIPEDRHNPHHRRHLHHHNPLHRNMHLPPFFQSL